MFSVIVIKLSIYKSVSITVWLGLVSTLSVSHLICYSIKFISHWSIIILTVDFVVSFMCFNCLVGCSSPSCFSIIMLVLLCPTNYCLRCSSFLLTICYCPHFSFVTTTPQYVCSILSLSIPTRLLYSHTYLII